MKISLSNVVVGSILDEQGRPIGFIGNLLIAAYVVQAVNAYTAPKPCSHSTVKSVHEDEGAVLFRCLLCQAVRGADPQSWVPK